MKIIRKFKFNKVNLFTFSLWIMLITLTISFISGCSTPSKIVLTTGFKDGELFRIEKISCFDKEALVYLASARSQYTTIYGEMIWSTSQNGVYLLDNVKENVLGQLAKVKMMTLMADDYNIDLTEDESKLMENAGKEYYLTLSDSQLQALHNPDQEDIINMYKDYALANKVYMDTVKDINLEISDDEARTVILKQIFISNENESARSRAEEVIYKATNGTAFDELVMEYSDSDDDTVYYTKTDVPELFLDAVFSLGKGEFSQMILGDDGYYIFYCVSPNDMSRTDSTKVAIITERQKKAFASVYDSYIVNKKYYLNEEIWEELDYDEKASGTVEDFFRIYSKYL